MVGSRNITEIIIGAAFRIHAAVGPGLFESVYKEILADDLTRDGLYVEREKVFPITYEGRRFEKAFRVDLAVENKVIVEVKSVVQLARFTSHSF